MGKKKHLANNFNSGEGKSLTSPEPSLGEAQRASENPEAEAWALADLPRALGLGFGSVHPALETGCV